MHGIPGLHSSAGISGETFKRNECNYQPESPFLTPAPVQNIPRSAWKLEKPELRNLKHFHQATEIANTEKRRVLSEAAGKIEANLVLNQYGI